ncbi:MAG: hypothetical protein HDR08_01695 [Lachnospiraceae bacterium]|nr:hypothetical protein [Lachnospiraceae bacterium]
MEKHKQKLSQDAALLDKYLGRYNCCRNRKKVLERRKNELTREFENPLAAVRLDGMPRGSSRGVGCAALSFQIDEINTRIGEKIKEMEKKYVEINDVIEFLPENSTERTIIEYKYIDGYRWAEICQLEHITRTPAVQYWRKGLYQLLEFAKVQQVVRDFKNE